MKHWWKKIVTIILLVAIGFGIYVFQLDYTQPDTSFGVTFSPIYATRDLELDWREAYLAILDELKVDNIRLSAYWDQIEPEQGLYDFADLDWQIEQASKRGISIVLAIGRRLPRWPECHDPVWLNKLSEDEIKTQTLQQLEAVVNRYKHNKAIIWWQVENEPLLQWFGICPPPDKQFLAEEIAFVKSLDTRVILTTDSGELSTWQGVAEEADIVGHTLYRVVWNKYLGFWNYFYIPPAFYTIKGRLAKKFHPNVQDVIVSELQMEPWTLGKRMVELTIEEQEKSFNLKRFDNNIAYAQATGASEIYLWGVEYWYWLKTQGQPQMWQRAKNLWEKGGE